MKAHGSWQWNLRSYSIIPRRSRVFKVAEFDTPKDMQQLFDTGLASPHDQDEYGQTLLHVKAPRHFG